ncbi:hypothetical protein C815_00812 [Firmicutes bacterium M10-2]|nr:hypothetical protein C815_00812 [Firmicutes bacterium M10-2]
MLTFNEYPIRILVKTKNKKLYIRFKDGEIVITSPSFLHDWQILELLKRNEDWLMEQIEKRSKSKETIKEEMAIQLFGESFVLKKGREVSIQGKTLFFTENEKQWKSFIRHYGVPRLRNRFEQLRVRFGYGPIQLRFGFYSSQWGSCTPSKKAISLNLNLVFVPQKCLDAIIIHELSHLEHPDHSKKFYDLVYERMPEYPYWIKQINHALIPHY